MRHYAVVGYMYLLFLPPPFLVVKEKSTIYIYTLYTYALLLLYKRFFALRIVGSSTEYRINGKVHNGVCSIGCIMYMYGYKGKCMSLHC